MDNVWFFKEKLLHNRCKVGNLLHYIPENRHVDSCEKLNKFNNSVIIIII